MPDLGWNRSFWNQGYDWAGRGEEWSEAWGGSEAQWFGTLLPRLHRALPAAAILEIAPGFGRWTRFLLPACRAYLGIDISAQCIAACRSQFAAARHARFVANDGLSLAAIGKQKFQLVFCFDSLVHAELDVFHAYIPQILAALAPGGVAFIHHSNLLALGPDAETPHARARSVSAGLVAGVVGTAGGVVLLQELIAWGITPGHDALTLFAQRRDFPDHVPVLLDNPQFMQDALDIRRFHAPWNAVLPGAG